MVERSERKAAGRVVRPKGVERRDEAAAAPHPAGAGACDWAGPAGRSGVWWHDDGRDGSRSTSMRKLSMLCCSSLAADSSSAPSLAPLHSTSPRSAFREAGAGGGGKGRPAAAASAPH